ncbi:phage tail tape measure protein [Nocardiopsis alba]|uniref:phage tail tape measure protein n=1 Tax=Nocardiopsis alba TaxID=53437 RepID=UPI003671DB5C
MASENAGYAVLTVIPSVRGIGAQMGAQFNAPLVKAARKAGDDTGATLASRAGASIRSGASQISGAVASVAASAAAAGGAALASGFATALDMSRATGTIQAQLGVTEAEAGRIGAAAGAVYSDGFGASMPEVSDAVGSVVQQMQFMRDASSADLQEVSRQAMVTADVLNVDVSRAARAAGQMVKTGLAKDAEEAFDLMTAGAQAGANAADDLADTYAEYSTQFRNMGLSGADTIGLMTQGLNAGARDADTVADAIKEFSIEAVAGTDRVRTGYEMLGMDADTMFAKIGEGGSSARGALDETLDALREVPDTTERNAIATELFGTKAEDLGAALYELDLDTAASGMGDMAGAAQDAADAMEDTDAQKLAAAWRELKTELGGELIPVLTRVASWVTNNMDTVKQAAVAVAGLGAAWATYKVAATAATVATGTWNIGKGIVQGAVDGGKALRDLGKRSRPALDTVRLRAMYAGDAIKGAATKAGDAAKGGISRLASGARTAGTAIATAGTRAATAARSGITAAATAARTAGTAALTSARSWGVLAAAQTRSAVAATRARVATIATAVAQRAVRLATVAWTAAQWLLNVAMTANPVGLIVAGIVLLVGAIVLAYNKVGWFRDAVNAAFAGIGAAASWLGQQATALWQNYIAPAFTAIGAVVSWVFSNVIMPAIRLYTSYVTGVLVPIVLWLWNSIIAPAFRGIGAVVSWAWTSVIRPVFSAIRGFISNTLGPAFLWIHRTIVLPVFNGIRTAISTAWSWIRDNAFTPMRSGISKVGDAFEAGKRAIKTAWTGIKDAAKAPVRFLVNTVYNKGVVPMWNKVAGLVGADELKTLRLPEGFARGGILPGRSTWRQGDDQLVPMRRGEGVAVSEAMRVPALRDELLRWNSLGVNGGTSALRRYAATGQGFAKGGIFGGDTSGVSMPNMGDLLVDLAAKGAAAFAGAGTWESALNVVVTPIRRALSAIGTTGFQGIPYMAAGTIRDKLAEWLDGNAIGGGGGAGVGTAKGTPGRVLAIARGAVGNYPEVPNGSNTNAITRWYGMNDQWCAMFISWLFAQANASGSLGRARRTAWTGDYYRSGMQRVGTRRPGDVLVYGTRHVNLSLGGRRTIGGNESNNVRYSNNYPGNPAIFRPAWAGMAKGGVVGQDMLSKSMLRRIGSQDDRQGSILYDTGGWLQPGYTTVENRTGKPEAVYTAAQQDRIERLIDAVDRAQGGGGLNLTVNAPGRGDAVDDVADGVVSGLRRARLGGLYPRAGVS